MLVRQARIRSNVRGLRLMNGDCTKPIAFSLGIMAYNEEVNIGRLLASAVSQTFSTVILTEIIVVASGCADNTEGVVRSWAERDSRIRLLTQAKREGKASAVNQFLAEAKEKILVLCSADLLPEGDAIEQVVAPFLDPAVGMTTSRPVPLDDPESFMGLCGTSVMGFASPNKLAWLQGRRTDR